MSPVQDSFEIPDPAPSLETVSLEIHKRTEVSKNTRLIVFIHGLNGDRYDTWRQFPSFVYEDFPDADVGMYGYRSGLRRWRFLRTTDIENESRTLASELCEQKKYTRIVLLCHSMGGLVARGAVALLSRKLKAERKNLQRISGILLFGTPQLGSVKLPRLAGWLSADARALVAHSKFVTDINSDLQSNFKLDEKLSPTVATNLPSWAICASSDLWVDRASATFGLPDCQVRTVRAAHTTVVKPHSREVLAYRFSAERIALALQAKIDSLVCRRAELADVPQIRALAGRYLTGPVTPEQELLALFRSAPDSTYILLRGSKPGAATAELAGYFCVLGLTGEALEKILSGSLKGFQLTAAHVSADCSAASAAYIGAVVGVGPKARKRIMEELRLYLRAHFDKGETRLVSRPVSTDGLRVCLQGGLKPVDPNRTGLEQLYHGIFRA